MNNLLKYSFALLLLVTSCAKNDFYNEEDELITATFNSYDSSGLTPILADGDKIILYDEDNQNATITLSTIKEPSTTIGLISSDNSIKFIKPHYLTGKTLYAVYPSTAGAGVDENTKKVKITIPASTDGTLEKATISVAQTKSSTMSFKNAVAIIELADKTTSIASIVLKGTNISGTFQVDLSGEKKCFINK